MVGFDSPEGSSMCEHEWDQLFLSPVGGVVCRRCDKTWNVDQAWDVLQRALRNEAGQRIQDNGKTTQPVSSQPAHAQKPRTFTFVLVPFALLLATLFALDRFLL